jgi:hypothetical protein
MNIYEKLNYIQCNLHAPKNQFNSFSNYNYRSCEDILEGLKPLLKETETAIAISDEIVSVEDRIYVKATVILMDCKKDGNKESVSNTAFAREALAKKGMDEAQITGAASSYARKYALNGLFAIDDVKDPDSKDNRDKPGNDIQKKKEELANEFIGDDETKSLEAESERTGVVIGQILKTYGLELLSEMRMGDYYSCMKLFEKQPTRKTKTGIK